MPRRSAFLFLLFLAMLPVRLAAQVAPTVAAVEFSGRVNVDEEILRRAVHLKVGEPFAPAQMDADRKAILGLGYFRSVGASQITENGRTSITFRLVEWPKVVHIRVTGNTVVDQKSIRDVISTQLGQVLCASQLQNDVRAIESLYRDRGYVARISEKLVEEATRSGILRFDVLELAIEDVVLEGGSSELRERARRELQELPPRLYRPADVAEDQQRLLRVKNVRGAVP
ncbi:MAG TPA: POTRA domain-containing protein, partial [Armatimonadota bacterium]|nr:POTRA domain-containing protein [Armatimonadota bacterium]